jgi:hypothetical protein
MRDGVHESAIEETEQRRIEIPQCTVAIRAIAVKQRRIAVWLAQILAVNERDRDLFLVRGGCVDTRSTA